MLQGIKEAAADMSPYVRKTAAHAIPKLAETDETCHDELIEIISRLLGDKELIKTRLKWPFSWLSVAWPAYIESNI